MLGRYDVGVDTVSKAVLKKAKKAARILLEPPVTVNDTVSQINCDCCQKPGVAVFYDLGTSTGRQVLVWWGYPKNWLCFIDEHNQAIYVCGKKCAVRFSKQRYSKEFGGP